ncbi:MAG: flavodoxin family protein [Oscillospiraceae bacterium]|jgi:multimeric flavodoxin WrbA|nr:flavodoxin family protein [Oscillospiraceae bacterium]
MKLLLINGSAHAKGSTWAALSEVEGALKEEGIETELFHIGVSPIQSCTQCGVCHEKGDGLCVYDDAVNVAKKKVSGVDGFVFGSPVHYASASGGITAFLDRFFFSGGDFAFKAGAAVAVARRAGTTVTLDQLNKYFSISGMMTVGSLYWNGVYGADAEEVRKDGEGMHTMRVLGRNMAWLLKSVEAGRKAGVQLPKTEPKVWTNFIR